APRFPAPVAGLADVGARGAERHRARARLAVLLGPLRTDYRPSTLPAAPPVARPGATSVEPPAMEPRIFAEDGVDSGRGRPDTLDGPVDPSLRALRLSLPPCLAEIEAAFAPAPATADTVDLARVEGEPALVAWVDTGDGTAVR